MKRMGWVVGLFATLLLVSAPASARAQEAGGSETINLFFDCQGFGCRDSDFFRREIPFVNWVRDREDSDVHVLVTSQATGGGGRQFRLVFLGQRAFEGQDQEFLANTSGDATDDDRRQAIAHRLRLGLVRYLAATPAADRLRVRFGDSPPRGGRGPGGPGAPGSGAAEASDDPWNFWVFNMRLNGFVNGESSQSFSNVNTSMSANRTTDAWKFNVRGSYSRNTNRFEISEEETIKRVQENWSVSTLLVKSLTSHWSVGARVGTGRTTFLNEDFRWNVSPGVEFNVFPYSESSRRSLTFQYLLNVRHWNYEEETIFFRTEETRLNESLTVDLGLNQPWGRTNLDLTAGHYFHDTSKYRVSLGGNIEVRLFKGFSVNLGGNYSWIRDQLHISGEGVSETDILLRQRQLATDFRYFTSFGVSYRFGSIFNNVVNTRFGGSGGGEFFMFF